MVRGGGGAHTGIRGGGHGSSTVDGGNLASLGAHKLL